MDTRPLGKTGLNVSPIGFGTFKIGRNQNIKYASAYDLPSDDAACSLLDTVYAAGVNLFDTAPAYGIAEERLGQWLQRQPQSGAGRVICTKVGEEFNEGQSTYQYNADAVENSLQRSRQRLGMETLDIVLIHSDGSDTDILQNTDVARILQQQREQGLIHAIGFSGKTTEGAAMAMHWADVIMVEYHINNRSHEDMLQRAHDQGIGILIKKGLQSGMLDARDAISFVLKNPNVTSLVIGGLTPGHMLENIKCASEYC